MEASVYRFARLLRSGGVRVSVPEITDAVRAVAEPGVLSERDLFRSALRSTLIKDERDGMTFAELFDRFFACVTFEAERPQPADSGKTLDDFEFAEELGQRPPRADMESPDAEMGELFTQERMFETYSPHPELNPIVLDNDTTDQVVFDQQQVASIEQSNQVRLDVDRLHGAPPGRLSRAPGHRLDVELSPGEQDALLGWLEQTEETVAEGDEQDAADLRARLVSVLAGLPDALRKHIETLLALERDVERAAAGPEAISGPEREQLEESLRRLASTLRGAPTHRKHEASRGRVNSARTMRRNMRYDGVPFRPITVARTDDKPRLMVLADVSLSVRATARFTLHLVHGLQDQFRQVRSFAFVNHVTEVTELFARHRAEHALGRIFGGDVLDVDADSDYGTVVGEFLDGFSRSITRRTTVLVLGDGRGNGNEPNLPAFAEITRAARETIWLTPEPRYSWSLGGCDLPAYAEYCDRVRVVRDLSGLERATLRMSEEPGR